MKPKKANTRPSLTRAKKNELISCPYQPGNLRISKSACRRRREASFDDRLYQSIHNEFFQFTVRQGLKICRNCNLNL